MGVQPVAPGEDTQWHLRWNLGWPDWLLVSFLALVAAGVVAIYLREGGAGRPVKLLLASLRLATIGLVLVMLAGLEISIVRTGLPFLVFLVDDSESMRVRDRPTSDDSALRPTGDGSGPSRLDSVRRWLGQDGGRRLAGLTSRYKLRLYAHANVPRELGTFIRSDELPALLEQLDRLTADGTESRIGSNLRTVLNDLRGTPPSAIVLVTDGITTAGEPLLQATQYAVRKNIPIFTVGVGDPQPPRDLELYDLMVDEAVFVDDIVTLEARLAGRGFEGQEVTVTLRPQGTEEPPVEKKYRIPDDGRPLKIRLSHIPKSKGSIVYRLDVPGDPRETQTQNNHLEREVRILEEKIHVLYVESVPRYEFRYLKNLLERESTIDLAVLLLDSDIEYAQQDRSAITAFPSSKEELFGHDVLIFGDVRPSGQITPTDLEHIRDFVREKGGGFLLIAGRDFAPQEYRDTVLEPLLPIDVGAPGREGQRTEQGGGFVPQLTIEGRANPIFRFVDDEGENERILASLPALYWYARSEKAKPGAQVLAVHPTDTSELTSQPIPLVAVQFFGSGRTLYQGYDATWRWRYRNEGIFHERYWIQAVRYLSRAKLLGTDRAAEIMVDRRVYKRGEPVQVRVRFLDEVAVTPGDEVAVTLEQEGQRQTPVQLDRLPGSPTVFESVLGHLDAGRYRARLTRPALQAPPMTEFMVVPPPGELDRVQMNQAELRQVADLTSGVYHSLDRADGLFDELPTGRRVALQTDPPVELWNTWPVLALFFGLLLLEWVGRKRKSML